MKLASKMALYKYFTREHLTYPDGAVSTQKQRAGRGNLPWNMADDGTPSDYCYSVWVLVVTTFSLT